MLQRDTPILRSNCNQLYKQSQTQNYTLATVNLKTLHSGGFTAITQTVNSVDEHSNFANSWLQLVLAYKVSTGQMCLGIRDGWMFWMMLWCFEIQQVVYRRKWPGRLRIKRADCKLPTQYMTQRLNRLTHRVQFLLYHFVKMDLQQENAKDL